MKNNKGFSLVELLITIAILSIVLTTVTSVMLTGSKQFTKGNADANMQNQAQLVVNQIEDMIIDTNGGVDYVDNTTERELVLYNAVTVSGTTSYFKEVIKWEGTDKKLSYSKWNVVYDTTSNSYVEDGAAIYADQLLAEDISDFKIDLSDTKKDRDKDGNEIDIVQSVQITVGCIGNEGQVSYATSPIITLRNRMMLSGNPNLIFPNTPTVDDTLTLYIAAAGAARVPIQDRVTTVERNGVYNVYAMIDDSTDVNALVNWSIEETNLQSTIDSTGMLQVGESEPNQYLTIVATYKNNPSKKAKGVVAVPAGKKIESVEIVTLALNSFELKYDSIVTVDGFTEEEKAALVYKWTVSEPDWVDTFVDSGTKLTLPIKKDVANLGKTFTIRLTVSAPSLGVGEVYDEVSYTLPDVIEDGDSYIERGKYQLVYSYDSSGYSNMANPQYTVYFCDENGNRKTEMDDLVDEVVEVTSCWAGGFNLKITHNLPANVTYYIKVIMHCQNWDGSQTYDYERILQIPAVKLSGQQTRVSWTGIGDSYSGIDYKLYGNYSTAEAWNTDDYAIEVQEVVSNAPSGVTISANVGNSYALDTENNLLRSDVTFSVSGDTSGVDTTQLRVYSVRVKIYMKEYTDVFTYATLTFIE